MKDGLLSSAPGRHGSGAAARIAEELSQAVLSHRILPGTKLREDELAEIFSVSRTIIRSALQYLAHDQLVTLTRNVGAAVAHPDPVEAREIMEARSLLEPRTAHSAAERITEADISALEASLTAEHAAMADGDTGRALALSGQFHRDIARIANQATIAAFIDMLVMRSSLIIALYWKRQSAICEEHAHHALVDAFRARDAQLAEDLMRSHIVDLATSLDLSRAADPAQSLRSALGKGS